MRYVNFLVVIGHGKNCGGGGGREIQTYTPAALKRKTTPKPVRSEARRAGMSSVVGKPVLGRLWCSKQPTKDGGDDESWYAWSCFQGEGKRTRTW